MDLSVFNLLMSTNPNSSAAENLFPNAVQGGISSTAGKAQDSLRTGEAFLQALDQVRTGQTEKNADVLYNALSARADASSSLKDLRKGGLSRENVKVVKLHIKRTRASEKLRKADEEKAALPTTQVQNGQKIPTRENIAADQEIAQAQPEQRIDVREAVQSLQFNEISVPEESVEQPERPFISTEELTAADILINSAIQTTLAPLPQTPQTNVNEKTPDSQVSPADFPPQKEAAPSDRPQTGDTHKASEILPEAPEKTQNSPVFMPVETNVQKQEGLVVPSDPKNAPAAQSEETPAPIAAIDTKRPESMRIASPVHQYDHETVKTDPVQTKTAPETNADERSSFVEMSTVRETQFFEQDHSSHHARRQAELLARELPAQTNIAVSVETHAPAVQEIVLPHTVSKHSSLTGKNKEFDTETAEPATEENRIQVVSAPAKELSLQSGKPEHLRPSEEQPEQTDQPNGLVTLPVQNKVLPTNSTTLQAEGQIPETGTPSVSGTPVAALSVGHELKGKAVSGNVPVQKNIPVNELVDQIKVNIKKALKDGLDKIDIVLKPKELGTIKIHLEIGKDGTMKAVLSTARAETLDLLQSDLSSLKQALADSGFDLNDQAFSFNYRGERFNEDQHHAHKHTHPFVNSEEEDLETDSVLSANTLSISGRYALNIRV